MTPCLTSCNYVLTAADTVTSRQYVKTMIRCKCRFAADSKLRQVPRSALANDIVKLWL